MSELAEVERRELLAQRQRARPAQLARQPGGLFVSLRVERIELRVHHPEARVLDRRPALGIRLVRLLDADLPVWQLRPLELDRQRGLAPRQLGVQATRGPADVPLHSEADKLARRGLPQALHRLAVEQPSVALVDRVEVEGRLAPREVQNVLEVETAQEFLGLGAIGVDVHWPASIGPMTGTQGARAARPRPGEELELDIESLAHGGNGVARRDGFVVFVQGGMPGDRLRAQVTKAKRGYAEARVVELIEPSPDRIEPRAAHPGAPWQVLPYERQLEEKERQVRDALERLGGFEDPPVEPIVPAVEQWRYRNKLEYSFGAGEDGELRLGFHRAGRWNEIDDVTDDVLASERVDDVRERVKAWCREEGLSAWDRRDGSGFLRNLVVREGGGRAACRRGWSPAPATSAWTSWPPLPAPTASCGRAPAAWPRPRAPARRGSCTARRRSWRSWTPSAPACASRYPRRRSSR